jgi:hypothetical protein
VGRFSPPLVAVAFADQHFSWHAQSDLSIDTAAFGAAFALRAFPVVFSIEEFFDEVDKELFIICSPEE